MNHQDAYTGVENLESMREAKRYNRFLVDLVLANRRGSGPVLDFGAGSGTFALLLRERDLEVRCLEPDRHLQTVLGSHGLPVVNSSAQVAKDSIDYIYSLNVLEHIDDDREALRDIHRMLRPGGRLLLYVPAFPVLFSTMDERVGHFRRYRRNPMVALARDVGFNVIHSSYVDSLGFLAALFYRFLGNQSGKISPDQVRNYDRFVFPVSRLLDHALGKVIGKNVFLVADKDG